MTDRADKPGAAKGRFRTAVGTAAVAAVFCAVVAALLAHNYSKMQGTDLRDSDQLNALKRELFNRPGDAELQQRIRKLDLQLRLDYFRRRRFAAVGGWLLLGGAGVWLLGLKAAVGLRRRAPVPAAKGPAAEGQRWAAAVGRWSIALVAALLVWAGGLMAVMTRSSLDALTTTDRSFPSPEEVKRNWPRFRGPGGAGVSAYANVPTTWNGKTGEGILWKTPVPLPGMNSPVLWEGRVFLTGATDKTREVYCFDADTGKLLWRRPVVTPGSAAEPPEVMEETGYAASTAAVDGRRVYAIFANGDLACFDFDGGRVWAKSLGAPESNYGHASSLAMHRNLLLIQYDQGTDPEQYMSQVIAIDGATGAVAWVQDREVFNSWPSPVVADTSAGPQLITAADPWVIAYDPASGEEIWRVDCMVGDVAPSPIYGAGLVFMAHSEARLVAIRPGGRGDVTKTHVAWTAEDGLPEVCSPLCDGSRLYLLASDGLLTCYRARDGKKLWEHEFDATFNSSPSLVGERIYLFSQDGTAYVIAAADQFNQIGRAELGEECDTCPAFADGRLYIRGKTHLFCIAAK